MTVCDNAQEHCPVFPGRAKVVHVGFDDPPRLAAAARTEEERLAPYRRVRDEIRAFVETLPAIAGNKRWLSRRPDEYQASFRGSRSDCDLLLARRPQAVEPLLCASVDFSYPSSTLASPSANFAAVAK